MASEAALNRTLQSAFIDELDSALGAGSEPLGLLLVQLNDIGELNLAHGYRTVDRALAAFAERLAAGFPQSKVVRVGTGRFAIVLAPLRSESLGLLAANKVQRLASTPLDLEQTEVEIGVCQGLALAPQHAADGAALFRCAETALDAARAHREAVVLYHPARGAERLSLQRVDSVLARALEQGSIEVVFQPQVALDDGRAVGAEALLRCRDTDGSWLSPELVVRSAERTGRLEQLMTAIANTALRYAADWPNPLLSVSLNASALSFKDRDFAAAIAATAALWDRPLASVTIEITETAFIDEPAKSFATMRRLRELGARVSIDDFGTGYASLSYFKDFPANELKVDKAFVLGMLENEIDRRIVTTVINLAHAFGLSVVAEGVEDEATLALLKQLGCDTAQGYLLGRPMPPPAFREWLRKKGTLPRSHR